MMFQTTVTERKIVTKTTDTLNSFQKTQIHLRKTLQREEATGEGITSRYSVYRKVLHD